MGILEETSCVESLAETTSNELVLAPILSGIVKVTLRWELAREDFNGRAVLPDCK